MLAPMVASSYSDIRSSLRQLYLEDPRPWLVGFSGGKDSTMLASLIVEVVAGIPDDQRKKQVAILWPENRSRELEEEVARERAINPDTLGRMVAKVEEYSESRRAHSLPDDLLNILKDDLDSQVVSDAVWFPRCHVESSPK